MKIERKLLTKDEYLKIFSGVETKLYSQIKKEILQNKNISCDMLDEYFDKLTLPAKFSINSFDITEKMNATNHIDLWYWEVRYFLQEAFRDSYLGYPYEAYLYRKILMLKSAFISWISLLDKIDKILDIQKDFPEFWVKYGKKDRGEANGGIKITWLGKERTLRQFANDIKHNHDYLSEIQIADMGYAYWTHSINGVSMFKSGAYGHDIVSNFFYQECFNKLLMAFNDTIKIVNQLPKVI